MTSELSTQTFRPVLAEITVSVFETMIGVPVQPAEPSLQDSAYALTAAVYYVGTWNGALLLECSVAQAQVWASHLMDIPFPVSVEDARDSLGELCNVLAGNLKPVLPPGVGLSSPSVVSGADYRLKVCGDPVSERLTFGDAEGTFGITLVLG